MRLSLVAFLTSFVAISSSALASQNFYDCQAVGNPTMKMSLAATPKSVAILLDNGTKIIGDDAKFAYHDGFDNQNFVMGGFKNWVSEVKGGNAYSGYMYIPGSLFKTGEGQVGLYRSYYRSEKDCGNESVWFNCKRD